MLSLTGKDLVVMKGRTFSDFGDGDIVTIEYPEDLVTVTQGKNGNIIYAFNAKGLLAKMKIKLLAGSDDDKFLNSEYLAYTQNPPGYTLIDGEFVKNIGDGQGNIIQNIYQFPGTGIITKLPAIKDNTEGDKEQAQVTYEITFGNTKRGLV